MKKRRLTLAQKRSGFGYVFLIPWLVGIIMFFLYPLFTTVQYSFGSIDMSTVEYQFTGITNFVDAFTKDAQFPVLLSTALLDCLKNVPLILFFSFFIAMILRKNFKGSFIVKSIFFLTVILASDVFLMLQNETVAVNDMPVQNIMEESQNVFSAMEDFSLEKYLIGFGLPQTVIDFIDAAITNVADITIHSGIQIFIFLAGLHAIPESMYEASNMEGATAWENIWKVTLPLMTPIILVNIVYTIVDSFMTMYNPLLQYIYDTAFKSFNFGYSAALSIIYFAIIGAAMGLILLFMRKRVYYQG